MNIQIPGERLPANFVRPDYFFGRTDFCWLVNDELGSSVEAHSYCALMLKTRRLEANRNQTQRCMSTLYAVSDKM